MGGKKKTYFEVYHKSKIEAKNMGKASSFTKNEVQAEGAHILERTFY